MMWSSVRRFLWFFPSSRRIIFKSLFYSFHMLLLRAILRKKINSYILKWYILLFMYVWCCWHVPYGIIRLMLLICTWLNCAFDFSLFLLFGLGSLWFPFNSSHVLLFYPFNILFWVYCRHIIEKNKLIYYEMRTLQGTIHLPFFCDVI